MSPQEVQALFQYHKPSPENVERIQRIRNACADLAQLILDETPGCTEQTLAIRSLHQASMHANFAIVRNDPIAT